MPGSELGVVRDQLQGTTKVNGSKGEEEVVRIGGSFWRANGQHAPPSIVRLLA